MTKVKSVIDGQETDILEIDIPNLWPVAMYLSDEGPAPDDMDQASKQVLTCWYQAHALLKHIRKEEQKL